LTRGGSARILLRLMRRAVPPLAVFVLTLCSAASSEALSTCQFEADGTTLVLTGDCTTDQSIVIPDGMTLDGRHFTITAMDPPAAAFEGAVIVNGGARASIVNARIMAILARPVCHEGAARLRGIFFDGASGTILGNVIEGINQGTSPCHEGNAIEVRHVVGTGAIVTVEIAGNRVEDFQKSGIVVSGDVYAWIHGNELGASATQSSVAANGVQVGFGAKALIERNVIAGNSWSIDAKWAATAVLLFGSAPGTVVRDNDIDGNADIGIHIQADLATVDGNRLFESGDDGFYDVGIGNYGTGNSVTSNRIRGYSTPYDPEDVAVIRVASR
jgi:hypothetical protein